MNCPLCNNENFIKLIERSFIGNSFFIRDNNIYCGDCDKKVNYVDSTFWNHTSLYKRIIYIKNGFRLTLFIEKKDRSNFILYKYSDTITSAVQRILNDYIITPKTVNMEYVEKVYNDALDQAMFI